MLQMKNLNCKLYILKKAKDFTLYFKVEEYRMRCAKLEAALVEQKIHEAAIEVTKTISFILNANNNNSEFLCIICNLLLINYMIGKVLHIEYVNCFNIELF